MDLLWFTAPDSLNALRCFISEIRGISHQFSFNCHETVGRVAARPFDAVVIDGPLEDVSVEEAIESIRGVDGRIAIIVRNGMGTVAEAVRSLRLGAAQYLGPEHAGDVTELRAALDAAGTRPPSAARKVAPASPWEDDQPWRQFLVGASSAMRNVTKVIRLVATRRCTVLITGETGTGKEMAAKAIHAASSRSSQSMVAVNCSAIPENLIEAELFGHMKGAFTGAANQRIGRFEQANKGTLFLDEIADLPLSMQTKLLRVLQEKEIQRLGSSDTIKVDFRLVAACNVRLEDLIRQGKFREDLYYRLNILPLEMPALRDRREDIPLLVNHFLQKHCEVEGIPVKHASGETMERLMSQSWPGNVRQLENAVEMAIALSGDREMLLPGDFRLASPIQWRPEQSSMPLALVQPATTSEIHVPESGIDFERVVGDFERNLLSQALERTNGNKKQAAEILRLKRTTFTAKLKSLEASVS